MNWVQGQSREFSKRRRGQRQNWKQGYSVGPKFIQEPGPKTRNGHNLQCMYKGSIQETRYLQHYAARQQQQLQKHQVWSHDKPDQGARNRRSNQKAHSANAVSAARYSRLPDTNRNGNTPAIHDNHWFSMTFWFTLPNLRQWKNLFLLPSHLARELERIIYPQRECCHKGRNKNRKEIGSYGEREQLFLSKLWWHYKQSRKPTAASTGVKWFSILPHSAPRLLHPKPWRRGNSPGRRSVINAPDKRNT